MPDQAGASEADYPFDVFVSYSHVDRPWVCEWLVPRLRAEGLTVCLDEDTFEPGVPALVNMRHAVAASRHTLLVLTPDYVASQWTNFELLQAQHRDPLGLARRTLPIVHKPCDIPESIAYLTHIDLTDAGRLDQQLVRLVAVIRGQSVFRPNGVAVEATVATAPVSTGPEAQQAVRESADAFGRGLSAIADLMREPEVRTAVGQFRERFEAACEQIGVLADYKGLHDQLHRLEFECFGTLVDDARLAVDDEKYRRRLRGHERIVREVVDELRELDGRGKVAERETDWIDELAAAQELLGQVREEFDPSRLDEAVDIVRDVLTQKPALVNTSLFRAAEALRLSALIEAMTHVRDRMDRPDSERQKVQSVREAVEALVQLDSRLRALVKAHDTWQQIDMDLRDTDPMLQRSTRRLERRWPSLKVKAEPLYAGSDERWAQRLAAEGAKLDSAIHARDPEDIQFAFIEYRAEAAMRFFDVDGALLKDCEALRESGRLLDGLLKQLDALLGRTG